MHHIELLPSRSTHATPGWTYVPDTRGFDPAKAAITPAIGRKRGIRDPGRADLSSRQTNAIIRHLAELDRENHRDVQIAIPVKNKDATRGSRGKVTSNVRRILQSQKTFRNYLDDEEAALAQAVQSTVPRPPANKVTKPPRRSLTPAVVPTKAEPSRSKKSTSLTAKQQQQQKKKQSRAAAATPAETETPSATTPATETETETEAEAESKPNTKQLIKSEHDNDPLLRSYIPSPPSARIMQALLSEPPLTYHAARAGPPATVTSKRYFCCMCGYWGKIRCKNCHLRTCGLECYKVHEDSRCGAFF